MVNESVEGKHPLVAGVFAPDMNAILAHLDSEMPTVELDLATAKYGSGCHRLVFLGL
jgi:hypothetical protein